VECDQITLFEFDASVDWAILIISSPSPSTSRGLHALRGSRRSSTAASRQAKTPPAVHWSKIGVEQQSGGPRPLA